MGMFVQQTEGPCSACGGKGYTIPKGKTCGTCKGKTTVKEKKTFNIDVEQGAQEGAEFRFRGQADEAPGHDTGDVVIILREKAHRTFQRIRDSLVMKKKISLSEALCGFEFSTDFLDGQKLTLRSAQGQVVRPGDIMVVEGKGMPRAHGQRPGDLFLILDVEFPQSLPQEERSRLSDILGGGPPVSEEPPPGAEVTKKLSQQQVQALKQRLAQAAAQERRESQGQAQCAQQ
jgi:DnaJ family protein A protein 2